MNYLLTTKGLIPNVPERELGTEMQKEWKQVFQTRLTSAARMERYLKYWYFQKH
jgi:hypothetical protein